MLLKPLITVLILIAFLSVAQTKADTYSLESIDQYSTAINEELLEIRRDLFSHPEASGQEKRTSGIVVDYLTDLGLEVKTNIGGYGVVGILKGSKKGKRIAWRADMDAAKFEYGDQHHDEKDADGDNNSNQASARVGHVCGHDVHTTIALGIAKTLSQDVDNLPGTVYLVFQPAEESQQGAKAMIRDGLFELIDPDEIYGVHVASMETGVITTAPGNVFSHARNLEIEFKGDEDAEEVYESVSSIMASLTRLRAPEAFANLLNTSHAELGLANPDTIYQNYVLFAGNPHMTRTENRISLRVELFASQEGELEQVVKAIEGQIGNSTFKERLVSVQMFHDREGVNNEKSLVNQTTQIIRDAYGESAVLDYYGQIPFASEDFGHFQKSVPGVYFFMGVADSEKGNVAFPHMPNFEVDEASIQIGVSRFTTLILNRLED